MAHIIIEFSPVGSYYSDCGYYQSQLDDIYTGISPQGHAVDDYGEFLRFVTKMYFDFYHTGKPSKYWEDHRKLFAFKDREYIGVINKFTGEVSTLSRDILATKLEGLMDVAIVYAYNGKLTSLLTVKNLKEFIKLIASE